MRSGAAQPPLDRATKILETACRAVEEDPRPLGLSNAAIAWPDDPYQRLWHATTVLREHRGDGHVSAPISRQLGPCEATVLRSACSGTSLESITSVRGWNDDAWNEAGQRLLARGVFQLNPDMNTGTTLPNTTMVTATGEGLELHRSVEELTNSLAAKPFSALAQDHDQLKAILTPLTSWLERSNVIPFANPIGVPPLSA